MSDDLLAAALSFASDGLPVFPCEPRGKHPLVKCGFKSATRETEQIRQWWAKWPKANIAIPTGAVSGFVALDIDPGGDDSLAELTRQYRALPETCEVKTGRGRQLWFESPAVPIGCKTGFRRGLDSRGDGGYVIVPPSIHANGRRYTFRDSCKLAKMPDWLIKVIRQGKAAPNPALPANGNSSEKIREGARNTTLASIAGTMRARGLGGTAIRAALLDHNSRQCDPPLPEAEVANIAASFAKYPPGAASPPSRLPDSPECLAKLECFAQIQRKPLRWV
jgi:putative DNA primase/helicase